MTMIPRILVMMSTYNGERYLAEQLQSIYGQIGVDIHILVRDDGSLDDTITILEQFRKEKGCMTILSDQNLGASYSFYELIRYATEEMPGFQYYAFSDQDDVWFPDKLESAVKLMERSEGNYQMAYSDWQPTDAALHPINLHQKKEMGSIGANIVSNHIAGCTQVFNRALLEKLNIINSQEAKDKLGRPTFYHDSWLSAVSYALGADIFHDSSARMYYRQHGANVIGAGKEGYINQLLIRIKRYLQRSDHSKSMKCEYLQLCLWDDVVDDNKFFVDLCANYRKRFVKRLRLLCCRKLYEYGIEENIGAFFLVLTNKF